MLDAYFSIRKKYRKVGQPCGRHSMRVFVRRAPVIRQVWPERAVDSIYKVIQPALELPFCDIACSIVRPQKSAVDSKLRKQHSCLLERVQGLGLAVEGVSSMGSK